MVWVWHSSELLDLPFHPMLSQMSKNSWIRAMEGDNFQPSAASDAQTCYLSRKFALHCRRMQDIKPPGMSQTHDPVLSTGITNKNPVQTSRPMYTCSFLSSWLTFIPWKIMIKFTFSRHFTTTLDKRWQENHGKPKWTMEHPWKTNRTNAAFSHLPG